jgi:NACalpha-BTF3-like transcription factor
MVQGVEMAARGDTEGFISMLDQAGSISGAGPVKRSGAAAPEFEGYTAEDGTPITEDDIQETMRANKMTREQVIQALKG